MTRAVVYALVVAVPIAVLAYLVRTQFGPLIDLDQEVSVAATDFTRSHDGFHSFAHAWEMVSQPWVMYAVLGVPACVFAWARLHLRTRAMWALATMATGWLIAVLLKLLVQRTRPVVEDPFAVHSGYSFPSGHATNNAIVVTVVLLLLRHAMGVTARRVLLAVGVAWVLITCADRIFMGAHYLSDVTAGVLLGVGLCAASYAGYLGWSPPNPTENHTKEAADDDAHQVA
ncbi:phosphatase PAP2 family protein [Nocardioides sp. MAH-18]|uniref:Phosphatase PAP2 family protein n=1 Tax=Nocardioides agri TaxID=2682843 RepID=A0A6L6XPP9_9ACTN|nr:phosphatase PAP2 family protein [Nocardioides sp. CGMCC 1.13656]MVQ47595.1 phosphatase PAP2 family protein [Nocardioides sp. MAH-18]